MASPKKSIYLVIAHGDEVLVGFNQNDPIEARPNVPANTEIVLFEHCSGYLPSVIDCPLMKLFMDKTAEKLLENPNDLLTKATLKNKIGLPPRLYKEGQKHPEINLTLQASWSEGKCFEDDMYSIMKSGTYKFPLTNENFPPLGEEYNRRYYSMCGAKMPHRDKDCHKYVAFYTDKNYKEVIPQAFTGSVLPTIKDIKPRGNPAYMIKAIYLSDFIKKMKEIDPNPSIFYIITCRAIPKAAKNLLQYHKNVVPSILAYSPRRMSLANNVNANAIKRAEEALEAEEKAKANAATKRANVAKQAKALKKALKKLKTKKNIKPYSLSNNNNNEEEFIEEVVESTTMLPPENTFNKLRLKALSKEATRRRKTQRRKRLPTYEEEEL